MKLVVLILMLPFIIPIIFAIIFIIRLVLKGKAEGFEGEVIEKLHTSKKDDDHKRLEHFYTLVIQTKEGKERKIAVSSQLYNECKEGDVIEKPKGAMFPKKISK